MPILNFTIRDKVMNHVSGNPYYVCGNSDYVVQLDMDEEWEFAIFTAIIKWKDSDEIEHRAVREFVGDAFVFPRINDAQYAYIGIYAGDKHTTTSGIVACRQSITSGDPPEEPPTPDVYDQIMELVNQALNRNKPPYIGANKHWYEWDADVGDFVDTGISAEGESGRAGMSPYIGANFHWYVGDPVTQTYFDTGINAKAPDHVGLTSEQSAVLVGIVHSMIGMFDYTTWKTGTAPEMLTALRAIETQFKDAFSEPDIYRDGDILHINGDVSAEKNNTTLEVTNK